MKTYTIKPEYVDRWTNMIEDEHKPVTEDEIRNLAREWDVPVEDLLEQVEECDEEFDNDPHWYLCDQRVDELFIEPMTAVSAGSAVRELIDAWESLTAHDQDRRTEFYAAYGYLRSGEVLYGDDGYAIAITRREINLNNGSGTWYSPDDVDAIYNGDEMVIDGFGGSWDAIVEMMDDDTRELVSDAYAPCTCEEFLRAYLLVAPGDLIVG